ncbi:putative nucleoredoxin 2 [Senna tora]|uniref:protein-disulfide reductase n=1 Tax=Senna tora TaxID=362788 RepID=A0A834TZQ8_9FABA|nr:putative nucleoredoxin 2 [Senna tora]
MRAEMKDETQPSLNNGTFTQYFSTSRFSSLLATKDRDFLISPTGAQVKVADVEGKIVGLLFAANWYPPCRNFTQMLVDIYEELRKSISDFEIVYVSSDEDLDAFHSFYGHMPWLAIPFSDLETKKALNRKYDVEGIPCLVILQPNDNKEDSTLRDGAELIYRFGVRAYPFTKQRLEQLQMEERQKHENQTLTNLLTNHLRDYVPVACLVGKTIGLYFSAQWCVPCVKFTPKLISIYHKIKQSLGEKGEQQEDFEIVLISNDRDQQSFDSYFGSMPWLALPYGDSEIKKLARHFDVQGIPCLVIIGPNGKTITRHGRNLINLYQEDAYPFTDAKVEALEKQIEEEAKGLPRLVCHEGHRHDLNLVSDGNGGGPFICCVCDEQGSSWAYQCLECGYEVHPRCVATVDPDRRR